MNVHKTFRGRPGRHLNVLCTFSLRPVSTGKSGISVLQSCAVDLEMVKNDKLKFLHNSLSAYLNINNLRNKITDLGEIPKVLRLTYFVISETKWNKSFSNAQFKLNGYEVRARKCWHKHGGGLIEFVRQSFIEKD